ncbi:MAG: rhomboid family intramembrane serine protease [Planctomycetia bacterium]|nr:rhomboid family intramembrane serine protease [Planctomycetia bacterium]
MRELTAIADKHDAQVFVDYLLTQNISAVIRMDEGHPVVWVHNEDDLEPARAIWNAFQQNPHDSKYRSAQKPAKELRKLKEKVDAKYAQLYKDSYEFWGRPSPKQVPITIALIIISVAVTFWTEFGGNVKNLLTLTMMDKVSNQLPLQVKIQPEAQAEAKKLQLESLFQGEFWRLITPIFLHFSTLHLLFNMYALYSLGGMIECRRSIWWYVMFILCTGIFSNVLQFMFPTLFDLHAAKVVVFGSPLFGGMSGVDFALFGFLVAKSVYSPEPGMVLPRDTIVTMLIWLVICMTGFIGSIANTAHVAGLLIGFAIGGFSKFRKRFFQQR